jgi:opacity protein-like surface antigen
MRHSAALTLLLVLCAVPASGEDSAQRRYYLDIRYEDLGSGVVKAHDGAGISVGANFGRYLGAEFAFDAYDVKVGEVSELEILGLIPQLRLRYPLLHDRLVPYMTGGAGLSVTQANDARAPVTWAGGKTAVHAAGSLGGGIEYFIADNVAVGLLGKYVFSGDVAYTAEERNSQINTSSALVGANVRAFYPELHPEEGAAAARNDTARFYLQVRTGTALLATLEPFPGIHATPEQPIFGSNLTPLFGAALGANIGRYAGVELMIENYELKLGNNALAGIGEYAVFPVTVQPRLRYPLLHDCLEPYAEGGIGAEFAEINDRGKPIVITAKDVTLIGTFGAGVEYYVMSNVSVGCEAQYVISRGHTLQIDDGPTLNGDLDSFLLSIGVRIGLFGV